MKTSCSVVTSSDPSVSAGVSGKVIEVARAALSVLAGARRMADLFYGWFGWGQYTNKQINVNVCKTCACT